MISIPRWSPASKPSCRRRRPTGARVTQRAGRDPRRPRRSHARGDRARSATDADALIEALRGERRITEPSSRAGAGRGSRRRTRCTTRRWPPTPGSSACAAPAEHARAGRRRLGCAALMGLSREEATATLERLTSAASSAAASFSPALRPRNTSTSRCWRRCSAARCMLAACPGPWRPRSNSRRCSCGAITCIPSIASPVQRACSRRRAAAGEDFPARVWEQDLLSARGGLPARVARSLGLAGEIVWTVFERARRPPRAPAVGLALRENAGWLRPRPTAAELDPRVKNVLLHLQLRAPRSLRISRRWPARHRTTRPRCGSSFWAGLVHARHVQRGLSRGSGGPAAEPPRGPARRRARSRRAARAARAAARHRPLERPRRRRKAVAGGSARRRCAHLLLARYGVLSRELAQGDWSTLRHTLLRMEYGGEVVRGYFVEAFPASVRARDTPARAGDAARAAAEPHVLVTIADPANLWGRGSRSRGATASARAPRASPPTWLVVRQGRPVLLVEGQGVRSRRSRAGSGGPRRRHPRAPGRRRAAACRCAACAVSTSRSGRAARSARARSSTRSSLPASAWTGRGCRGTATRSALALSRRLPRTEYARPDLRSRRDAGRPPCMRTYFAWAPLPRRRRCAYDGCDHVRRDRRSGRGISVRGRAGSAPRGPGWTSHDSRGRPR